MVSYCCVEGCDNNTYKKKVDPNSGLSFHALPANQELRTKWLKAIGRPNWVPPNYARICCVHFNHDQINNEGYRIRLKDDAIPVNLLPANSNFEASTVEVCSICLATDIKLYSLQNPNLATCMEVLIGFNLQGLDLEVLPQFVCCLCIPSLIKCNKLIEECKRSQETLLDIFAKHGEINKDLIRERNSSEKKSSVSHFNEYSSKYNDIKTDTTTDSNDNEEKHYKSEDDSDTSIHTRIFKTKKCKVEARDNEFEDIKISTSDCESLENDLEINRQDDKEKYTQIIQIKKKLAINKSNGVKSDGRKHLNITKEFHCEQCDVAFASERARRVHIRTSTAHRTKSDLSTTTIETPRLHACCKKCGTKFTSHRDLLSHMKAEHPRPRRKGYSWNGDTHYPIRCEICDYTITTRKKHWLHFLQQHPKDVTSYQAVITAVCDTCGKGFQNTTKLRHHQLRHRSPTLPCKHCLRLFYDKFDLARHARSHSADKPYKCRMCERAFKQPSNLERHYKVHSDIASYECTICSKKFKYSTSMKLHVRTVHNKLPYAPRKKRSNTAKKSDS